VALALIDAINKHNERNPGKKVLFLTYHLADLRRAIEERYDPKQLRRQDWLIDLYCLSHLPPNSASLSSAMSAVNPPKSRHLGNFSDSWPCAVFGRDFVV